jgi:fluoroquinolone transport system permease protein
MSVVRHLLRNDVRLIARDKMLATMTVVVLLMGIAMRFALPAIDTALASAGVMPSADSSLRFSDTYPAFVVFVALWQGANIPGIIFGFVLLGEKEDNTLEAMRVTPLSLERYAGYRVAASALFAFVIIVYLTLSIGWSAVPLWQLIPLAAAASLAAPLSVLAYATFADNKIQGLAYTKFGGLAGLIILAGYFVPQPWQWLLGVFPPFLAAKAYWMALEGQMAALGPLIAAVVFQLGIIRMLLRRFHAQA